MAFKDLTDSEKDLVISIPYRAGMWISHIDDNEKTGIDNKKERQALEKAIDQYSNIGNKMPFVAFVCSHIMKNKTAQTSWERDNETEQFFAALSQAISICKKSLGKSDVKQYKQLIWQMAMIVAQAYGENKDPDNEMHVNRFFEWVGTFVGTPSLKKIPENMSVREKSALQKLRAVLKQ